MEAQGGMRKEEGEEGALQAGAMMKGIGSGSRLGTSVFGGDGDERRWKGGELCFRSFSFSGLILAEFRATVLVAIRCRLVLSQPKERVQFVTVFLKGGYAGRQCRGPWTVDRESWSLAAVEYSRLDCWLPGKRCKAWLGTAKNGSTSG